LILPVATPPAVAAVQKPFLLSVCTSPLPPWLFYRLGLPCCAQPFGLGAGCLMPTPSRCQSHLSSTTSHVQTATSETSRLRLRFAIRCVLSVASGGFSVENRPSLVRFPGRRVLSSALLHGVSYDTLYAWS
jgi:hypothetical protein